MTDIQLVIFDCDGVLIDSEVLSMNLWISLLAEKGINIDEAYFKSHFLGRSFSHVKAHVYQAFELSVTPALADTFAQRLRHVFTQHLRVTPGLYEVLPKLRIPSALATSSSPQRTQHALACTGLDTLFTPQQIFTAAQVKNGKPAPDLFLLVARHYSVAPQHCLVIEDSEPGLLAAKAAGMQWRHYSGGSHMQARCDAQQTLTNWKEFVVQFPHLLY